MPVLHLKIDPEVVDEPVPNLPFAVRREFVTMQSFDVQRATGGGAVALPTTGITTLQALVLQSDKAVTVAMGNISLEAGGMIVVYGGTPATSPPTVTNASGSTATVRGIALGT